MYFGTSKSGIVVAVNHAAGVVYLGVGLPHQEDGGRGARPIARLAALAVAVVGRAQHLAGGRTAHAAALPARAGEGDHGLHAVGGLVVVVLFLDDGVCLVHGDLFPLVLAAVFVGAFHGMDDAVGVIHLLEHVHATHAQTPLRDRLVLVAFHLDQLAVFDVKLQAARHRMAPRRRPCAGAGNGHAVFLFPAPRLAQIVFELHGISSRTLLKNSTCGNSRFETRRRRLDKVRKAGRHPKFIVSRGKCPFNLHCGAQVTYNFLRTLTAG